MSPEERSVKQERGQARFDRLSVEFWKEYQEAVKPICEQYGMSLVVSGYESDDVVGEPPQWPSWPTRFRSVYSIENEIINRGRDRES